MSNICIEIKAFHGNAQEFAGCGKTFMITSYDYEKYYGFYIEITEIKAGLTMVVVM